MYISKISPFIKTPVIWDYGPTLLQHDLILTITSATILFSNKLMCQNTGG